MNLEFKELIELFKDVTKEGKNFIGRQPPSIRVQAMKNIAYFPVLMSENVDKTVLAPLLHSIEQEYTQFIKLLIGSAGFVEDGDVYKKLGIRTSATEFHNLQLEDVDLRKWDETYIEDFRPITEVYNMVPISLHPTQVLNEASPPKLHSKEFTKEFSGMSEKQRSKFIKDIYGDDVAVVSIDELEGTKIGAVLNTAVKNHERFSKIEPTLFEVSIFMPVPGGGSQEIKRALGVKTVPHLIPTMELTYNIAKAVKNENLFFNLIQWKTGEKKFWKDLVFRVKEMRNTVAMSRESRTGHIWHSLYMTKNQNSVSRLFANGEILPSATIVLTDNEVEGLRNYDGIDIMLPKHADRVMRSLGIMGLIVVDIAGDALHVFADESKTWLNYPLDYIHDKSRQDRDMQQIIDMVGKR